MTKLGAALCACALFGCASAAEKDPVRPPPPSLAQTMEAACGKFVDATEPSAPRILAKGLATEGHGTLLCMRVRAGQDVRCAGEPPVVTHVERAGPVVISCGAQDGEASTALYYVDVVP